MMEGQAAASAEPKTVMIDATYLNANRTASSLQFNKWILTALIGCTKGGMNTKLHAVREANGRPLSLFMTVSCPLLSGPSTMTVWIEEGTTNACEEAQTRRDHWQAA